MKRINKLSLILCGLLLLTSCGNAGTESGADTSAPNETTAPAEESSKFVRDDLPDDLDFGGKTVNIMVGDYNSAYIEDMYSEEESGNRLSDSIFNTINKVQERLSVKLAYNWETYTWGELSAFQSKIIADIMAGGGSFDILFDVMNYSSQMQEGDYFLNLAELEYINIDKPWYNQTVKANMPDDYIYFLSGQFSLANVKNAFGIYYNADLFKALGHTEDLYGLVDSGKWTLAKLEEIIKGGYSDVNGNTKVDGDDRFGLTFGDANKYLGFMKSFGVDMFRKTNDGYEFTFDNERTLNVIEKLCKLTNENEDVLSALPNGDNEEYMISSGGGNYASKPFIKGNAIFSCGLLTDASTIIPSIDFSYGLLPYPKWDESEEYATSLQRSCYAMIPVSVSDEKAAGAVLEALSSESYRTIIPEYCEVSLKVRYSQDDDVSRMFDLIINSVVYDPGEIYSSLLGSPSAQYRESIKGNNPNWASKVAGMKDALVEKMNGIVSGK